MAIKLTTDCEKTNVLDGGFQVYEAPTSNGGTARPDAIVRSNVRFRNGSFSYKVHLESTDGNAQFGNRRAELTFNNSNNPDTTLRWYAVSWYFPAATTLTDNREHAIIQWHDKSANCSTSPPFSLHVKNDRFRVARNYSTADYCSNQGSKVGPIFTDLGAVPKDQWVDFVFYYFPSTTSSGEIRVWMNDVLLYSFVGITTYVGSLFPYLKIGIYKWLWNGTLVSPNVVEFFMDRIRIADSSSVYADVAITPSTPNILPNVTAGNSAVYSNSTTSGSLTGTATDSDGTIASLLWTQVEGPNIAAITTPTALTTTITGLIPGLYTFKLQATDNSGGVASAQTTRRVNYLPSINLKTNTTFYNSGTTSINLISVVSDSDGSIASYQWALVDGPSAVTFTTPTLGTTGVNGLVSGVYRFSLTVTDNNGDSSTSEVSITIATSYKLKIRKKLQ